MLEGYLDERGLYGFNSLTLANKHNCALRIFSKLFSFANNTTSSHIQYHVSINVDNHVMWHCRLGHANPITVKHVLKLCNIHVNNKNHEQFFHSYCLGKSHRIHAPLTHTKYNNVFELFHTNLWGPSPTPYRGG